MDSTGIKVEGEGEWNDRKHGGTKRRVWRKIHIGIDEKTLEIRAAEFTTSDIGDAPMLPELLDQIPPDQEIGRTIGRRWSGYHRGSRAETKMHCVKLLGQRLSAREFDRQVAEFQVLVAVLNGFTALGIPVTEAVG